MTGKSRWRAIALLLRQGLLLLAAPHALRWRLETFGLYMPSLPEQRPWWRPAPRVLRQLLGQMPAYMRWLTEMAEVRGRAQQSAQSDRVAGWERWLEPSTPRPSVHNDDDGDTEPPL